MDGIYHHREGGSSRSPAHMPKVGINEDTVFRASYPRIMDMGTVYSHICRGMISQVHVEEPDFLVRQVVSIGPQTFKGSPTPGVNRSDPNCFWC